jgi:hypothetical protein
LPQPVHQSQLAADLVHHVHHAVKLQLQLLNLAQPKALLRLKHQ